MKITAKNSAIAQTIEDIVSKGGVLVLPTVARVHALVSGSAADAAAGTGARTVEVIGINASFEEAIETVILNGVTPVNTVNSYLCINRLKVLTAGSGLKNAGIITATAATDGTISSQIEVGVNKSQQAIYMQPENKFSRVKAFNVSCYNSTAGAVTTVDILTKQETGVWIVEWSIDLYSGQPAYIDKDCAEFPAIKPCSAFKVAAVASAGSSAVNVNFEIE